jgi:hypothetical protein
MAVTTNIPALAKSGAEGLIPRRNPAKSGAEMPVLQAIDESAGGRA